MLQYLLNTAQKMKFSIENLFSKYDQICRKLRIWSRLLKKSLMENFIFCVVKIRKQKQYRLIQQLANLLYFGRSST